MCIRQTKQISMGIIIVIIIIIVLYGRCYSIRIFPIYLSILLFARYMEALDYIRAYMLDYRVLFFKKYCRNYKTI